MRKGSRHSSSAHGSRSMARWVRQDGGRVVRSSGPYGPLHRCPRLRHCARRRGDASAASRSPRACARVVENIHLSAQPPADRSVQRLKQWRCWTAPTYGWAARPRSCPPLVRQRARIVVAPCLTLLSPEGPHVLVLAACSRLCLALPWPRRRRWGAGALAPPAPAITRGLPAPPRTAPPIRHGAAVRVCGPARLWTSVAGTARAGRARAVPGRAGVGWRAVW
jgi:hypothetical protein